MNFNTNSEKSRFIFKPNPLDPKTFDILENRSGLGEYKPAGSYVLLDDSEDETLTEKRLVNLVSVLNGKGPSVDLSDQVETRTLFSVLPRQYDNDPTKIIYRTHDGNGVSKELAIFTIRNGVLYDDSKH